MKKIILILILFWGSANAQLQNLLQALDDPDSTQVLYGSPESTTPFWTIFTNLAVSTDSIMASLQDLGKVDGNYADLASAVTAASNDTAYLRITQRHAITSATTISGQTALIVQQGARFNITRKLTISVPFIAGPWQCFEGTGLQDSVVFSPGTIDKAYTEWFGADPTDSADDSLAIQATINAIPVGGRIEFLEGTYVIDPGHIELKKPITLYGLNKNTSIIDGLDNNRGSGSGGDAMIEADSVDNITIAHLRIENDGDVGNFTFNSCRNVTIFDCVVQQDSTGTDTELILFRDTGGRTSSNLKVLYSDLTPSFNAVNVNVATTVRANGVWIVGNEIDGDNSTANGIIKISQGVDNCWIINNNIDGKNSVIQGINLSEGFTGVHVIGNKITNVTSIGIRIEEGPTDEPAEDVWIKENRISNTGVDGIDLTFPDTTLTNVMIEDNIIVAGAGNSGGKGIDDADIGRLVNAILDGNIITGFDSDGITMRSDSSLIINNIIRSDSSARSLTIAATAAGTIVTGNHFYATSGTIVQNSGSGTKFSANKGYDTNNSGTTTLSNGSTTKLVLHGLDITPAAGNIMVNPIETLSAASFFWVNAITDSSFTINVNADPTADVDFAWQVND